MDKANIKQLEKMIEVIARSIPKERQAHDIYQTTAEEARSEMTRLLFRMLADQEEQHEAKLRAVLELLQEELKTSKGLGHPVGESVVMDEEDLPWEEKLEELEKVMEVVVRMIPKEKSAHKLYSHTAENSQRDMTRDLFLKLAEQEKVHEQKLTGILDLLKEEYERIRTEKS